jgi:hypothetical protein
MRKIISELLSVFIFFGIIGFMPIFEEKAEAVTNGIYTYTILDDKATITKCSTSASGAIEIPSTLDGYLVTDIGYSAFSECHNLTTVTIPNSVTTIGSAAFWECTSLKSVTIPNNVTYLGSNAFAYCNGLTSVTIPDSVTYLGSNAFSYCSGLNSVTIPNSMQPMAMVKKYEK